MNEAVSFPDRQPIKLTVPGFLLLRGFGAFDAYWKVELLDGELWGVPGDGDDEPPSDAVHPIKLSVEQYELLARSGAFIDHYKTELIDGVVYSMSPQHRPHGFVKDRLAFRLHHALEMLKSPLMVATEQSVAIPRFHEPQPDIVLTSQPMGPGPIPSDSVALVIEVSDTTRRFDLKHKSLIYAAADIAEYWVVDVAKRVIRQMWKPERGMYSERQDVAFGEPLVAQTIAGLSIATDKI